MPTYRRSFRPTWEVMLLSDRFIGIQIYAHDEDEDEDEAPIISLACTAEQATKLGTELLVTATEIGGKEGL